MEAAVRGVSVLPARGRPHRGLTAPASSEDGPGAPGEGQCGQGESGSCGSCGGVGCSDTMLASEKKSHFSFDCSHVCALIILTQGRK